MVTKIIFGDNDLGGDGDCRDELEGLDFVACLICLKTVVKEVEIC